MSKPLSIIPPPSEREITDSFREVGEALLKKLQSKKAKQK